MNKKLVLVVVALMAVVLTMPAAIADQQTQKNCGKYSTDLDCECNKNRWKITVYIPYPEGLVFDYAFCEKGKIKFE